MSTLGDGYYKAYEEYSKTLRTWLVAYGIGAPALLLSSDGLRKAIVDAGAAPAVGALFLIGVGLQVTIAAINKSTMWAMYYLEDVAPPVEGQEPWWGKLAVWLSEQFWIDLLIDVGTGAMFILATAKIFWVLTA
jgi:hypothetical protein